MSDLVCVVLNEVKNGREVDQSTGSFDEAPNIRNAHCLNQGELNRPTGRYEQRIHWVIGHVLSHKWLLHYYIYPMGP